MKPITIKADPSNPNRMEDADKKRMAASLAEFGDLGGIVINQRTGLLIGGHQRVSVLGDSLKIEDLKKPEPDGTVGRGWITKDGRRYAVRIVDWDEAKAHAALLAANRFGRVGKDDNALLKDLLEELDTGANDMDLTGFDQAAIENLMTQYHVEDDADAEPQVDMAEQLNSEKWHVKPGDMFLIGNHRLLCGDSTNAEDVGRLLGDAKPVLMVTDPPYGVNYDPTWRADAGINKNTGKMGKVSNDDVADWSPAWRLFPGDAAYVYHAALMSSTVHESLELCSFKIRAQIIWAKDRMALSRGDYHWKHEPLWYAVRDGKHGHRTDDRKQTTLWEIPAREDSGHGHSTQKPIECMARPMRNHVASEVYDPFLGSGTTMVAGENLGRKVYGLEIAPKYCAVILQRMTDAFPGIKIHREECGVA